jgi:hypothetical protein
MQPSLLSAQLQPMLRCNIPGVESKEGPDRIASLVSGVTIMTKTIAIFAAAAAAMTSTTGMARDLSADANAQRFVHDGSTYVYTTKTVAGRRVIDGRRYPSGTGFHLVVRGDAVSGTSGGVPVAFRVAAAKGAAIEVAAR